MRDVEFGCLILTGLLAATGAQAVSLGQASTPAGASFSSACAGLGFAGGGNAGDNVERIIEGNNANCAEQTSGVGGSAAASETDSGVSGGVSFSNAAQGSAAPLVIHLQSSNSAAVGAGFPGGETNAGFSDEITVAKAGATGTGVWVIPINVVGQMSAVGLGADGILSVAAFQNQAFVQQYNNSTNLAAYDTFLALDSPVYRGSPSGSSWDYENVEWRVVDYGPSDPQTLQTLAVNDTIFFAIPFTWNTPFDLGVYANVAAGETSSGPGTIPNATSLNFKNTISWGGPGYVLTNGGSGPSTTSFSILSLTGANYSQPYGAVPEPSAWTMLVTGFGGLGAVMRGARRRPARASQA